MVVYSSPARYALLSMHLYRSSYGIHAFAFNGIKPCFIFIRFTHGRSFSGTKLLKLCLFPLHPADLALEDTAKLQQYLSMYVHATLDTVETKSAEKIVQIVFTQEALTHVRSAAELRIVDNADRMVTAEILDQVAAEVKKQMYRDGDGKYHYEEKISALADDLIENAKFIKAAELNIEEAQKTIEKYEAVLADGKPQLHLGKRMSWLMLMNTGMVLFEAYNLGSAFDSFWKKVDMRSGIDLGSALVDFAATIATSVQFVHESKYGTWKQIAARLDDPAKEAFVKTLSVDARILTRAKIIYFTSVGTNIASGVLSALIASIDAHNRWVLGDRDAAVAYGVTVVGFTLTAMVLFRH